jgi:hypothetical protein
MVIKASKALKLGHTHRNRGRDTKEKPTKLHGKFKTVKILL